MRHFRNPICSALSVLPMLLHRRHGHGLDSSSGIGLTPWAATLVDDSTRLVGAAYDLISPRDRRTTLAADGNEPTAPSSSTPPPPMPPPPAPPPPTPPSPLAPPPPSHYPLPMPWGKAIHRPPWQRATLATYRVRGGQVAPFDGRDHTGPRSSKQTDKSPSHAREKLLNRFIACPAELGANTC
jgi:hypothetical protein